MDYSPGYSPGRIQEWVAFPFSRWSSQPRGRTQVSRIAGGFFTTWATREAQEYQSEYPILSPVDLSNPGINLPLLHYRQILYPLSDQGSPTWLVILENRNGWLYLISFHPFLFSRMSQLQWAAVLTCPLLCCKFNCKSPLICEWLQKTVVYWGAM